jgi:hypothetical protein
MFITTPSCSLLLLSLSDRIAVALMPINATAASTRSP